MDVEKFHPPHEFKETVELYDVPNGRLTTWEDVESSEEE